MNRIITPILVLSLSINAQALDSSSCTEIDLTPKLGPTQNQGMMGWCYAYASSDLVSFELGERVSPIDMAYSYNNRHLSMLRHKNLKTNEQWAIDLKKRVSERNKKKFEDFDKESKVVGGFISDAINLSEFGFCKEKMINTNDLDHYNNYKTHSAMNEITFNLRSLKSATLADCKAYMRVQKMFPGLDLVEIDKILKAQNESNQTNLLDKVCGERLKLPEKIKAESLILEPDVYKDELDSNNYQLSKASFENINEHFTSLKKPIGISVKMADIHPDKNTIHNYHAMVLAGRKFNPVTNKCEYIIRNSWGNECSPLFTVPCDPSNGQLTISEDVFKRSVYKAHIMK